MTAGLMQTPPLQIIDILKFASKAHAKRQIVSRLVDEPAWRYDYAGALKRAAQAANALETALADLAHWLKGSGGTAGNQPPQADGASAGRGVGQHGETPGQHGDAGLVNATAWFTLRLPSAITAVMRRVMVVPGGCPPTDTAVTAEEVSGASGDQLPSGFCTSTS